MTSLLLSHAPRPCLEVLFCNTVNGLQYVNIQLERAYWFIVDTRPQLSLPLSTRHSICLFDLESTP